MYRHGPMKNFPGSPAKKRSQKNLKKKKSQTQDNNAHMVHAIIPSEEMTDQKIPDKEILNKELPPKKAPEKEPQEGELSHE